MLRHCPLALPAAARYPGAMSRAPVALLASLAWFVAYVAGVVMLADALAPMSWAAQAGYFLLAGLLWVGPVWGLMRWALRV